MGSAPTRSKAAKHTYLHKQSEILKNQSQSDKQDSEQQGSTTDNRVDDTLNDNSFKLQQQQDQAYQSLQIITIKNVKVNQQNKMSDEVHLRKWKQQKLNMCNQIEGVVHLVENDELNWTECIDTNEGRGDNIIHRVCRDNNKKILEYILMKVYSSTKYQFMEIVADQVNNVGEDVVDICTTNNSQNCLKRLLLTGAIDLKNNYQRYLQRALVSNAIESVKILQQNTQDGNVFKERRLNGDYLEGISQINIQKIHSADSSKQRTPINNQNNDYSLVSYLDPYFLHLPASVYGKHAGEHYMDQKQIVWLSPQQIMNEQSMKSQNKKENTTPVQAKLFTKISPYDVQQGQSKTCYLLAVLCTMNQDQIQACFSKIEAENGRYWCRFYVCGEQRVIEVDQYLPCSFNTRLPIFAKVSSNGSFWACLIEKAWAKLQGSYIQTNNFQIEEAIEALTPLPSEGFWLKDLSNEDLTRFVERNLSGNCMLIATSKEISTNSLASNHAYAVLQVFILKENSQLVLKMRNPWGNNSWSGVLSKRIPQLREQYRNEFFEEEKEGVFYMILSEFAQHFSYICLAKQIPNFIFQSTAVPMKHRKARYFKFQLDSIQKICFRLHQVANSKGHLDKIEFRLFQLSKPIQQLAYNAIDCWESLQVTYLNRKQLFLTLPPGEYALKVKVYKSDEDKAENQCITVSHYSSCRILLEIINKQEGKTINQSYIEKSLFREVQSVYQFKEGKGNVYSEWDKFYRFIVKIENKGEKQLTYKGNIRMKQNLVLATTDVSVISKYLIETILPPSSTKFIKFKIKNPSKKPKIDILHSMNF